MVGGVGIKIKLNKNLYLFDDWVLFFNDFFKSFLVKTKKKNDVKICLSGLKTKGLRVVNTSQDILYPSLSDDGELVFDNLLHPSYFLACLEKLIRPVLLKRNFMFLHASAFVKKDKAYLITGDSGSGKSTLMNNIKDKYVVLADDSVVVGMDKKGKIVAYPSPMNMKIKVNIENKGYKVGGVLTVDKGKKLSIKQMPKFGATSILLNQFRQRLNNKQIVKLCLKMTQELSDRFWLLSYRLGKDDVLEIIDML